MSRTKTVFGSHEQTAHVWAQNSGIDYGRASDGRIFFYGATIYSYGHHFPVARFVKNAHGETCVLFTARSYSASTGKHKSLIRSAISSVPIFTIEDVTSAPSREDITKAQAALNDAAASLARSTPYDLDNAIARLQNQADHVNAMAEFFGISERVTMPVIDPKSLAKIEARIARKQAREAAEREARRLAKLESDRRTLAEYREGGHHDLREREWGFSVTLTADDHAAHDFAYTEIMRDKATAWRAGKMVNWGRGEDRPMMLRVKGDEIQTSQGASFPRAHGIKAFAFIAACRAKGVAWERNGHTVPLGHFQIDRIEADGTVHAGCHVVPWSEVEAIARQLGLID